MPSRSRYVVKKWQNIVNVVCERPLVYLELTNKSNPSQVQFTLTKEKLTFCQMVTTPSGFSEGWTSHQPAHLSILEKHVNIYFILKRSVSFVNLFSRVQSGGRRQKPWKNIRIGIFRCFLNISAGMRMPDNMGLIFTFTLRNVTFNGLN